MVNDTVDGRNPAPPNMYEIQYLRYQLVNAWFLNHQQYKLIYQQIQWTVKVESSNSFAEGLWPIQTIQGLTCLTTEKDVFEAK